MATRGVEKAPGVLTEWLLVVEAGFIGNGTSTVNVLLECLGDGADAERMEKHLRPQRGLSGR